MPSLFQYIMVFSFSSMLDKVVKVLMHNIAAQWLMRIDFDWVVVFHRK